MPPAKRYTVNSQTSIGGVMHLTAIFEKVPEGYIGFIEEFPGANTQGATLEEARANLTEAVELILEASRTLAEVTILGQEVIREKMLLPAA
jgi:predicted RNase H-like HicB family nuclease